MTLVLLSLSGGAGAGFLDQLKQSLDNAGARQPAAAAPVPPAAPHGAQAQVVYKGYARQFLPVKQLIYAGELQQAADFYATGDQQMLPAIGSEFSAQLGQADAGGNGGDGRIDLKDDDLAFLNLLEMGTLRLDSGDPDIAIDNLQQAQQVLSLRDQKGKVTEGAGKVLGFLAETLSGNEELSAYEGEGYEKVLMLNYQSVGYMLQGDRKAYNVARRAMDWQQQEERAFRERLEEAQRKIADKEASGGTVPDAIDARYRRFDQQAERVKSAYVNPFGWYVNGMVLEFESYTGFAGDTWDGARIAYQKALELNPQSPVIKQIVADFKGRRGPNTSVKLLHVLVADGFAPEKKVLINQLNTPSGPLPVQRPIYEPVANPVARIAVQTSSGKRIAELHPIADIEAIALRHQKDSEPFNTLRVLLATARTAAENSLLSGTPLGGLFRNSRDEFATPDTRSWMSLPASIQGARLRLKKGVRRLYLASYDANGKRLGREPFDLEGAEHSFVYARSINGRLFVQRAPSLWIAGR